MLRATRINRINWVYPGGDFSVRLASEQALKSTGRINRINRIGVEKMAQYQAHRDNPDKQNNPVYPVYPGDYPKTASRTMTRIITGNTPKGVPGLSGHAVRSVKAGSA